MKRPVAKISNHSRRLATFASDVSDHSRRSPTFASRCFASSLNAPLVLQLLYSDAVRRSFVKHKHQIVGKQSWTLLLYGLAYLLPIGSNFIRSAFCILVLDLASCPCFSALPLHPVARISSNLGSLYQRGLFYMAFEPAPGLHSSFKGQSKLCVKSSAYERNLTLLWRKIP